MIWVSPLIGRPILGLQRMTHWDRHRQSPLGVRSVSFLTWPPSFFVPLLPLWEGCYQMSLCYEKVSEIRYSTQAEKNALGIRLW